MKIVYPKILLVIFFLVHTTISLSQTSKLDSLENELKIHTQKDTTRVRLLNELGNELSKTDIEQATDLLEESENLADKLNFKLGKADALYHKSHLERIKSNYDVSSEKAQQALEIYKSIGNKKGISYSLNSIGIIHYVRGNTSKAIEYYQKSAEIDEERNDQDGIAGSLNNIGNIYADEGDYEKAISYYTRAKDIKQKTNDNIGVARAYLNIGTIYAEQSNLPSALEQFNKALNACNCPDEKDMLASITEAIAFIHGAQSHFDKAIEFYTKSMDIHEQLQNRAGVARCLKYMGSIYTHQSLNEKAIEFFNRALEIYEQIGNDIGVAQNLLSIAEAQSILEKDDEALINYEKAIKIYHEKEWESLGLSTCFLGVAKIYTDRGKYEEAKDYVFKSMEIANKRMLIEHQKSAHQILSIIYENTGDYKNALLNHRQYKLLNDSIFNEQTIEKLTQIEYEYKYKQELESASNKALKLTQKVKRSNKNLERSQRNYLMAIIAILILTIVSVCVIFYMKLRNAKAKNKNIEIEQKLLRSQMTPHFMFNSLAVLQGMILNEGSKKSVLYLSKFSKLLRITLENSRDKTVLLSQELVAIENYLALQNLEESYPLQHTILVDQKIDTAAIKIPPMLIQPFIENAIEHAFINQKEAKKIDIHLSDSNGRLVCSIKDNGIGIDSQPKLKKEQKTSLATTITSERLHLLSQNSKVKGSIKIEDRSKYNEQGTIVTLLIPYSHQKGDQ